VHKNVTDSLEMLKLLKKRWQGLMRAGGDPWGHAEMGSGP